MDNRQKTVQAIQRAMEDPQADPSAQMSAALRLALGEAAERELTARNLPYPAVQALFALVLGPPSPARRPRRWSGDFARQGPRPDPAAETGYDLLFDEQVLLQSVAAQYGVLPAAQRGTALAGMDHAGGGPDGHNAAGASGGGSAPRGDPAILRRMTPWQRRERARWRQFLAGRAGRSRAETRQSQQQLQRQLARMFGTP